MTQQEVFRRYKKQYGTESEFPKDGEVDILTVKSDPVLNGFYRTQERFFSLFFPYQS